MSQPIDLKSLPRPVRISVHADADGVSSACLLKSMVGEAVVEVQRDFGKWSSGTDIIADMVPIGDFKGVCIDHHPHPETFGYSLVWKSHPAALIVWNEWKNEIPRESWWKVVSGLVGEGAPYLIPPEVFKQESSLLRRVNSLYPKAGTVNVYSNPVWLLLSSPINALCKTRQENVAFSVLDSCAGPLDLLRHPIALDAKSSLKAEVEKKMREGLFLTVNEILIGAIDSEFAVERDIATRLEAETHQTTLIVNFRGRRASLRGVMTSYLRELFKDRTLLDIGGHPGFMGATLVGKIEEVIERIKRDV